MQFSMFQYSSVQKKCSMFYFFSASETRTDCTGMNWNWNTWRTRCMHF
ncbi:unnamed protein product [Staurois parvus]|uniref:Uncharacterized protein n=1 Tax=Staurois parvus TaxID=386267 RepID=A0ABN9AY35_9NEOB|nr:unnamed protein product [Staurois parvus]